MKKYMLLVFENKEFALFVAEAVDFEKIWGDSASGYTFMIIPIEEEEIEYDRMEFYHPETDSKAEWIVCDSVEHAELIVKVKFLFGSN